MSYAIESKKRKFERILESLTDGPQTILRAAGDRPRDASDTSNASSKRRRVPPIEAPTVSLLNHYLPSSRPAFRERLKTYRSVTRWHIPSTTEINAAEWAKRGWICVDNDTVSCPSCGEQVTVDLDTSMTTQLNQESPDREVLAEDDENDLTNMADAVYEQLIHRYKDMVVTAHRDTCPWRQRGCDLSIQRIEGLLNTTHALSELRARYLEISSEVNDLSNVADLPPSGGQSGVDIVLNRFKVDGQDSMNTNLLKLAICGWRKKDADVLECHHCFRSLGLWLYRGSQPAMDQLDAVESHLEYCPWQSPAAQDVELAATHTHETGTSYAKVKIPGWTLVYRAMEKENAKSTVLQTGSVTMISKQTGDSEEPETPTPDQREHKLNEIRRRIRDLKKPFNFKSLLRKKEKMVVS